MVYSTGGSGVKVGRGDAVIVGARVCVWVGVVVMVGVTVGSTTLPLLRSTPNTTAAPMPTSRTTNPNAIGRFRVISGRRGPWMDLFSLPEGEALLKVCPQTWQRAALSLTFEPQVGQDFVEGLLVSSVIMFYAGKFSRLVKNYTIAGLPLLSRFIIISFAGLGIIELCTASISTSLSVKNGAATVISSPGQECRLPFPHM